MGVCSGKPEPEGKPEALWEECFKVAGQAPDMAKVNELIQAGIDIRYLVRDPLGSTGVPWVSVGVAGRAESERARVLSHTQTHSTRHTY